MSNNDKSNESKTVTFKEKYNSGITWQEKAVLISLYHTAMCVKYPTWVIKDTASHFEISIGLVSENIRLAKAIDGPDGPKILKCKTREEGLKFIDRRRYVRFRSEFTLIKFDNDEDL
jgi:hypothetical protein